MREFIRVLSMTQYRLYLNVVFILTDLLRKVNHSPLLLILLETALPCSETFAGSAKTIGHAKVLLWGLLLVLLNLVFQCLYFPI